MTETTWDPSDTDGWTLSNGNLTATSPDNNTMQSVFVAFAQNPIPDDAKTYFEYTVSGAAVQTAFTVGFGVHGFNPSAVNLKAEGAIIPNATFLGFSYNLGIANSGNVIYDPQDNADFAKIHPGAIAAPNQWPNGSIIGVLVDRIDNTVQFTLNGAPQGGPFDISGLGSKTVFPFAYSWFKSGPVATINGGTHAFAESLPAGYTPLDGSSAGSGGTGGSGGSGGSGTPPSTVTIGSGPDTLALKVSEDAYQGNAQFTVFVDGHQIGGTQTTTASHAAGQTQTFNVLGTFAAGSHTATVDFLNDAYGGSPSTDRNLYVNGATIDGSVVSGATLTEHFPGPQSFSFLAPSTSGSGSTSDTVTVNRPAALIAGVQTITGTESDPSQSIFLDWRGFGTPVIGDSDWVQATVTSSGSFSAAMNIDHAGAQGTMFYRVGSGPAIAAWSGTP